MKLYYHNKVNFGDALNPLLFDKLLPNFFDGKENEVFLGIGSILGVFKAMPGYTQKIHVFTSGFAYGSVPNWDSSIDVNYLAVRGPLSAKKMKLGSEKGIADGGILIEQLIFDADEKFDRVAEFSFMPHHYSLDKYDGYAGLCKHLDIQFISPVVTSDNGIFQIIDQIRRSGVLITEALHGAIIADALRVPFIPVKSFQHVNEFKWKDYQKSLNMDFKLKKLQRLYSKEFLTKKMYQKAGVPGSWGRQAHRLLQNTKLLNEDKLLKQLENLKSSCPAIQSNSHLLNSKKEQLLELLRTFRHQSKLGVN